jgi:putative ABC transport system permease protein
VSGFIAAIVEAWSELKINRTRVMLSLIGVAVAVCAITVVVGAGGLVTQVQTEANERGSGRPAMISLSAYDQTAGVQAPAEVMEPAFEQIVDRYQVTYSSRSAYLQQRAQLPTGVQDIYGSAVDPDYGTMHRVQLVEGRWFTDADVGRLAPSIVVNQALWRSLGSPDLATHPTLELEAEIPLTGVIIGITPSSVDYTSPEAFILFDTWKQLTPPEVQEQNGASYELWVPPEMADQLVSVLQRDLPGDVGEQYLAYVNRNDYLAYADGDPLFALKAVIGGVAGLVLLLGALGLVNISLVTVRQRIREIGIRRSFGATAGRVFFSVMMESIVATVAAGVIGVAVAVFIVQNPWVQDKLANGVIDLPPFPIEAALFGLAASAVVGALAGLLPALVAVRVKVIDAIRY